MKDTYRRDWKIGERVQISHAHDKHPGKTGTIVRAPSPNVKGERPFPVELDGGERVWFHPFWLNRE
jgi:hypothetical protein